eukprot:2553349-Pyramimonas_sp.AAC.3
MLESSCTNILCISQRTQHAHKLTRAFSLANTRARTSSLNFDSGHVCTIKAHLSVVGFAAKFVVDLLCFRSSEGYPGVQCSAGRLWSGRHVDERHVDARRHHGVVDLNGCGCPTASHLDPHRLVQYCRAFD